MQVYGSSDSGNCLKVKWVADYVGRPFSWTETSAFNGETRTPQFLALNPAGQVPVVVFEDGRTLAQSNAIMLHLAEGTGLIPSDAYSRAKMLEWLFWEQYSHEPAIAVRIARLFYLKHKPEDLDPALLTKGNAALTVMELALTKSAFLAGEAMSVADVALVAYTRKAGKGGFDLEQYLSVKAWISRVESELGLESGQDL